jgi:hypothetical protein
MVATGGTRYPTHAAAAPEPHVRPVIVKQAEIEVTSRTRAAADRQQDCMLQLQERRCAVTTHREMLSVKKLMGEQQDIGVELMKKDGNG